MCSPCKIGERGGSFCRGLIELGFLGINASYVVDFFLSSWAVASPSFVWSIAVIALFQALVGLGQAVFRGVTSATIGALYRGPACSCNVSVSLTVKALGEFTP